MGLVVCCRSSRACLRSSAIFGHGNVTCLSEALEAVKVTLPTWRGQNERSMALTAIGVRESLSSPPDHGSDEFVWARRTEHDDSCSRRPRQPPARS